MADTPTPSAAAGHRPILTIGLLTGLVGVIVAALAAHGPLAPVDHVAQRQVDTAILLHFVHAIGLILLALWPGPARVKVPVTALWLTGTVLFSGSLYSLTMLDLAWPGPITPIGGLFLMLGWLLWLVGAWLPRSR